MSVLSIMICAETSTLLSFLNRWMHQLITESAILPIRIAFFSDFRISANRPTTTTKAMTPMTAALT